MNISKVFCMTKENIEILEESVLMAADKVAEDAKDQGTKTLVNLFKSVVLKKYKDAFDQELSLGEVHKKNIDKAVDFCYEDICVTIRRCSEWTVEEKEGLVREGKMMKGKVKDAVFLILANKGIKVV